MRSDILEKVALDLLCIPALTFRGIRKKLIKTALADMDVDITPLHIEIIRLLEEEGTLHVVKIGEKLQIAKAQMTKLIDKLVDLNLVERKMDTADRRTINISLSAQGRSIIEEHKTRIMNAMQETMAQLSDEDLKDLSGSLRKLQDILSKLQ
jgi:DNA-binding MarR family transcriptional regulator